VFVVAAASACAADPFYLLPWREPFPSFVCLAKRDTRIDILRVPAGPNWLNRRVFPSPKRNTRQTNPKPPLMRFPSFPFSVYRLRCAVRRLPAFRVRTIPLRRSILCTDAAGGRSSSENLVLAVLLFCSFAPGVHAVRGSRRSEPRLTHRIRSGHASRSLFGATFRYPNHRMLTQLGRTPAFSAPGSGNAHGIRLPFAVFPIRASRRL
jgi:hypothetical protein